VKFLSELIGLLQCSKI